MRISTYYLFNMLMQPIHIKLTPCKLLLGLISGVSITCCLILVGLPISLAIKCVIIALIIASSVFFILRDVLFRLPNSWQIIDVSNKGELILTNKKSQQFTLTPAPSSFIHAACSVLNFKSNDIKRKGFNFVFPPVILFSSKENANELRRLRMWLRWFKHQEDLSASDLAA